jgi:hypothetical protein
MENSWRESHLIRRAELVHLSSANLTQLNDSTSLGRNGRETAIQADYQKTLSALRYQETLCAAGLKVLKQENRTMKARLERISSLDL